VLTNGDAFEQFHPASLNTVFRLGRRTAGLYTVMSLMRPTWIRRRVQGENASTPLDPALTRRWITPALADRGIRRDTAKFLRGVDASELLEVSKRLRRFTKPVVLLWGDADRFFPIDLAHRLREAFPNAVLIQIPGGRLFFPLDVPQVAEQIESRRDLGHFCVFSRRGGQRYRRGDRRARTRA